MNTNKDTIKAVNAARTLIKYCARYKDCQKCAFRAVIPRCAINRPYDYAPSILKRIEEKGAQDVKK